jgi:hypothetical protein
MSLIFWALRLVENLPMPPRLLVMALWMVVGELAPFRIKFAFSAGLVPWHPVQFAA